MADPFAQFLASIAHLSGAEARKAKLVYLRNALVSYSVYIEDARSYGVLHIALAAIPVFWPVLVMQRRSMVNGARAHRQNIRAAIDAWDLGDEALTLRRELDALSVREPRILPWPRRKQPQLTS